MALSLSTKILLALGTVGTAMYAINRRDAKKRKRKKTTKTPTTQKSRDEACLFKVHGEGGQTIGASERIMSDLHPSLQTEEVGQTVVDMEPEYAEVAYEYMLHLIGNQNYDILSSPSVRDDAIGKTVALIASGCDWSEGLSPYTYGSIFQKVWTGAGTLGELAQTNLEAKGIEEDVPEEEGD